MTYLKAAILASLAVFLFYLYSAHSDGNGEEKKGEKARVGPYENWLAPNFTVLDMNNNKVELGEKREKVVLMNFWATWCFPCLMELPELQRLNDRLKGEDFEIMAINLDQKDRKGVEPLLKHLKISIPVYFDYTGEAMKNYRVNPIPVSFVMDRKGRIRKRAAGVFQWGNDEWVNWFKKIMKE